MRPNNAEESGWFWLSRTVGAGELQHAAWYWCADCQQWEVAPDFAFSAEAAAEQGWAILAPTTPPGAE